jgi:hypothetical protein
MFENYVLRKIFGPKRWEAKVGSRKLHYEALDRLHSSPNIIRFYHIKKDKMGWESGTYREDKTSIQFRYLKKRQLG